MRTFAIVLLLLALLPLGGMAQSPFADGMHDPSTPTFCAGRWYVFTTGRGCLERSSADLIHWQAEPPVFATLPASLQAAVPKNQHADVWAPEVKYLNGQYDLWYAVSSWGSRNSAIGLATNPTLNPKDPRYHWTDQGVVVQTTAQQNYNAIDPSVLLAPDGRLWLSFGSFFSGVKLIQLDPKTGKPLPGAPTLPLVNTGEASYLDYHDGWYYLFFNIGTCCRGKNSTYNIRMGRARSVVGPYLDKYGVDLRQGGGSLFLASAGGRIGPGQIGIFSDHGKPMFSCHDEWDDAYNDGQGGGSVLDIRPLSWQDGWPSAGPLGVAAQPNGTYQLLNIRSGCVLEVKNNATDDGSPVRLWSSWAGPCQTWTLVPEANGEDALRGVGSGKSLTVQSGTLVIATDTGADMQRWHLVSVPGGAYQVLSSDGDALTALGTHQGAALGLAPNQHLDTQKWLCVAP